MADLINGRTPEEIIEANRHCSRCFCDECAYFSAIECQTDLRRDCADLVKHLEAKQPKWIKLTEDDRPPDGYYNVMVKKRGVWQRDLLRYDANDDDWWKELSTHDELVPGYLITHWMPLPELPEEER